MKLLNLTKRNLALILIVLGVLSLSSGLLLETVAGALPPPQNASPAVTKEYQQRQSSTRLRAAPWYQAGRLLLGIGLGLGVVQSVLHLGHRRSGN